MSKATASQKKIDAAAESNGWSIGCAYEGNYDVIFERGTQTVVVQYSKTGSVVRAYDYQSRETLTSRDSNKVEKVIAWLTSRDGLDVADDLAVWEIDERPEAVAPVAKATESEFTADDMFTEADIKRFIQDEGGDGFDEPARREFSNGAIAIENTDQAGQWDLITGDSMSGHTIIDFDVFTGRTGAESESGLPLVIWSNASGGVIENGEYSTWAELETAVNNWGVYNLVEVDAVYEEEDTGDQAPVVDPFTAPAESFVAPAPAVDRTPAPVVDPFTAPAEPFAAPVPDTRCLATYGSDHMFVCTLDLGHPGDHEDHVTDPPAVYAWSDGYDCAPTTADSYSSRVGAFEASVATGNRDMIQYTINLLNISELNQVIDQAITDRISLNRSSADYRHAGDVIQVASSELIDRTVFDGRMTVHKMAYQIRTIGYQTISSGDFAFVWEWSHKRGHGDDSVGNYNDTHFLWFLNQGKRPFMPHLDCSTLGFSHDWSVKDTDATAGVDYAMCIRCARSGEFDSATGELLRIGLRYIANGDRLSRLEHF